MFYHLDMDIEVKEDIMDAVTVLNVAHELEPFISGEEITQFLTLLFFEDGVKPDNKELLQKLDKAGKKWFWWVIEGRVADTKRK